MLNIDTYATSTSYVLSAQRIIVLIDLARFINPKFYFEAVLKTTIVGSPAYAELYNVTDGTPVAGSEVSVNETTPKRVRSGSLTLLSVAKEYTWRYHATSPAQNWAYAVRLIIVDEFTTLTKLEHLVEISQSGTTTSSTFVTFSYPKYYYFEENKFEGTLTVYFEVTMYVSAMTGEAQLYNVTDGVPVAGSTVSTTSTTHKRVRSGTITLVNGKEYTVRFRNTTSGKTTYLRGAKIIIQQTGTDIAKTQIIKSCGYFKSNRTLEYARIFNQIYLDKGNLPYELTFYYEADLSLSVACSDLFNITDNTSVPQSEVCGAGRKRSVSITLIDLKEYDSRIRTTDLAYTVYIYKAWVIIDYVYAVPPPPFVKKAEQIVRIKWIRPIAIIKRNGVVIAHCTPYTPFRVPRRVKVIEME